VRTKTAELWSRERWLPRRKTTWQTAAGLRPQLGAWDQAARQSDRRLAADPKFDQCKTPFALAVWVAIASINGGDRQSYGSRPSSFSRERIAPI
jgi:O6-methylguanine-DNA--protein-cysteine methyltransferase